MRNGCCKKSEGFKYQITLFIQSNDGPCSANFYADDFRVNGWGQLEFVDEDGVNHWYHGTYDITEYVVK